MCCMRQNSPPTTMPLVEDRDAHLFWSARLSIDDTTDTTLHRYFWSACPAAGVQRTSPRESALCVRGLQSSTSHFCAKTKQKAKTVWRAAAAAPTTAGTNLSLCTNLRHVSQQNLRVYECRCCAPNPTFTPAQARLLMPIPKAPTNRQRAEEQRQNTQVKTASPRRRAQHWNVAVAPDFPAAFPSKPAGAENGNTPTPHSPKRRKKESTDLHLYGRWGGLSLEGQLPLTPRFADLPHPTKRGCEKPNTGRKHHYGSRRYKHRSRQAFLRKGTTSC